MASRSSSSSNVKLAESLATVAIASLGGPVAAAGSALTEVVKYARARYEAQIGQQTHDLRQQVSTRINQWAVGEQLGPVDTRLGLQTAIEAIARFGLTWTAIVDADLNSIIVSQRVVDAAKNKDAYWGTEDLYLVAERAIGETYSVLIRKVQDREQVLLPVIRAMHTQIASDLLNLKSMARDSKLALQELAASQTATASTDEVQAYLRARIDDWNMSAFPGDHAPSSLERRLLVRTAGTTPIPTGRQMTSAEALAGQRMLVVLGGPGSGKSWLARRYARETAEVALSALQDGTNVGEVELPLLTTWDLWTRKATGDTAQALITASFDASVGPTPLPTETRDRLERTFAHPEQRVLMVVDSLDEAADIRGQHNQLRGLTIMATSSTWRWRVVVTSRLAAWEATYRSRPSPSNEPQVVELQNLTYPEDIEEFVDVWFGTGSRRGAALKAQFRARDDLRRNAAIPLMLTFYCLLTAEATEPDEALPAYRSTLYQKLVRLLLRSGWVANLPGPDAGPDLELCETLLGAWAWDAVGNSHTVAGLGDWGDTFAPPTSPKEDARAIDNVAAKVAQSATGMITRRFVHRTILEHFVAEHVGGLGADDAFAKLLPHLWFDPDWQIAAPAAIVAHNHRHRGALVEKLLNQTLQPAVDFAREVANGEFDRLLLTVAQESAPDAWNQEHEELIHQCRVRNAAADPELVAKSAHWTLSNRNVRAALMGVLPTTHPFAGRLVAALVRLDPTDDDRTQARTILLNRLSTANPADVGYLSAALPVLVTTEDERTRVRTALLNLTHMTQPWAVESLVATLTALVTTGDERARTRTVLLNFVINADILSIGRLAAGLAGLEPTDAERARARASILQHLTTADAGAATTLITALPLLEPTDAERARARATILQHLTTADAGAAGTLITALTLLEPTDAERARARSALLDLLHTADNPWSALVLVGALLTVDPTSHNTTQARSVLLEFLHSTDSAGPDLVKALLDLEATDTDRDQARASLLGYLPTIDLGSAGQLVAALQQLNPSSNDRSRARAILVNRLPTAGWATGQLLAALLSLDPTDEDREKVRHALLGGLPTGVGNVADLVTVLADLNATEEDWNQARTAFRNRLRTADPATVGYLAAALADLNATGDDLHEARTALLRHLPAANPSVVPTLVATLRRVSSAQSWLEWLSGADSYSGVGAHESASNQEHA